MNSYSETVYDPVAKTKICLPLKLQFSAFYRIHWIELSGYNGQKHNYIRLKKVFLSLREVIYLFKKRLLYCQAIKVSRKDICSAPKLEFAKPPKGLTNVTASKASTYQPSIHIFSLIFVISDSFTQLLVPNSTPINDGETATVVWLRQWISSVSPKLFVTHKLAEKFIRLTAKNENFRQWISSKIPWRSLSEKLSESQNKHFCRFIRTTTAEKK